MKFYVRFFSLILVLLILTSCSIADTKQTKITSNQDTQQNETKESYLLGDLDVDGNFINKKIIVGKSPVDNNIYPRTNFIREDAYNERLKEEYDAYINLSKIDTYEVIGKNEKLPAKTITRSELGIIVNLITSYKISTRYGDSGKNNILTITNFDLIKPFEKIKIITTKNRTKAYHLYTIDKKILCIIYNCIDGVLYFDRVAFFDEIQSYYSLTKNDKLTYKEGKATKKNLYQNYKKITQLSNFYMSHMDIPYCADKWTTHITDKGFLLIGYDKNKEKEHVKVYSILSKGILKKLHRSLLRDLQ